MRETLILHEVRAALVESGHWMGWRSNTGVDIARGVKYGLGLGGADLVGMLRPSGRFAAFEVKVPGGRGPSAEQRLWLAAVRASGGFATVVRSAEDALAALARAQLGLDS